MCPIRWSERLLVAGSELLVCGVGNYDLLLDVASLQNLESIYRSAQAVCEGN